MTLWLHQQLRVGIAPNFVTGPVLTISALTTGSCSTDMPVPKGPTVYTREEVESCFRMTKLERILSRSRMKNNKATIFVSSLDNPHVCSPITVVCLVPDGVLNDDLWLYGDRYERHTYG